MLCGLLAGLLLAGPSQAAAPVTRSLTPDGLNALLDDRPRLTVRYAPSTPVEEIQSHIRLIESALAGAQADFSPPSSHIVFTGFFVTGLDLHQLLPFQELFPGILSVTPSRKFRCSGAKNWGLDRINSYTMPLEGFSFKPDFTGEGVDVYIVDSGIDTTHVEFKGNARRVVANVYDSRFSQLKNIPPNNDEVGHGTHIAGIVGGRTVGVAPSANIWGVRVMDSSGEGYDSDIILGLQFVYDLFLAWRRPPSVINMSLGGPCGSQEDCANDAIVQAVEVLTKEGIAVVVAAGNSECDACLETPAFAPSAITVGATDRQDRAAIFSDFGKCVDVFAPGEDITSACSSSMCGVSNTYVALSGTSMATPFVTGVVAQLFQAVPDASFEMASDMIGCLAGKGLLDIVQDEAPSVTRNLLLQSPRKGNMEQAVCDLGAGCTSSCSSHGLCQGGECLCDSGWWGDSCHTQEFGKHCGDGLVFVGYELFDVAMSGWGSAEFRVERQIDGNVLPVLSTSMCGGRNESSGMCLEPQKLYKIWVSADSTSSTHIGYRICGQFGGGPSTQSVTVENDGSCSLVCAHFEYMVLSQGINTLADGWHGGYYQLLDRYNGAVVAGGTLVGFNRVETHPICLKENSDSLVAVIVGSTISGVGTWKFCDRNGPVSDDFAFFDLIKGTCKYVSPLSQGVSNEFALGEFSTSGTQWDGYVDVRVNTMSSLALYNDSKSYSVGQGHLYHGFVNQSNYIVSSSSDFWHFYSSTKNLSSSKFWISCGSRGVLGESFKFKSSGMSCVRDCLGLNALSQLNNAGANLVTLTAMHFPFELDKIRVLIGSTNLCLGDSLVPGSLSCFRLIMGAGTVVSSPSWTLCGIHFPSNAVVDICVRDWTECSANTTFVPLCKANSNGLLIVLYDASGKGWAESEYLLFDVAALIMSQEDTTTNDDYTGDDSYGQFDSSAASSTQNSSSTAQAKYIARGTLDVGYTGYGSFCIPDGCYALVVTPGSQRSTIAWLLCGHVGQAGETFFFRVMLPFLS